MSSKMVHTRHVMSREVCAALFTLNVSQVIRGQWTLSGHWFWLMTIHSGRIHRRLGGELEEYYWDSVVWPFVASSHFQCRDGMKPDAQLHPTVQTKLTGMFPLVARRHADPRNLIQAHEEGRHTQRSARVTQVSLCNNCGLLDWFLFQFCTLGQM